MLECNAKNAILQFVRTFRVVRRRHIYNFFSKEFGSREVHWHVRKMLQNKELYEIDGEIISVFHETKLRRNTIDYTDMLQCLDAMTSILESHSVRWMSTADYPVDIMFMTTGNELYDMSFFNQRNWVQKCSLLSYAWKRGYVADQPDVFNHIAVIPNLEMAKDLRHYGFSQFVDMNGNGTIRGIYDN